MTKASYLQSSLRLGTCRNTHGCVYEFGSTIGARLYCAKTDLLDTFAVTEYSVLNAQLYDLHHVCGEHLYARIAAK